jgi:hypothetical protein
VLLCLHQAALRVHHARRAHFALSADDAGAAARCGDRNTRPSSQHARPNGITQDCKILQGARSRGGRTVQMDSTQGL